MQKIQNIALIGNGNVSRFFSRAFSAKNLQVKTFARHPHPKVKDFPIQNFIEKSDNFDLVLLCVNDDSIAEISSQLPVSKAIFAHVSGAVSLETLDKKHPRRAVFYPLMSFRPDSKISIGKIPFCLEAENEEDLSVLQKMVEELGAAHYLVNSEQRQFLHLAAVFSHNFSNHLFHISEAVLEKENLDFKIILPLLANAIEQLKSRSAYELQTGPARRGDQKTIEKHLQILDNNSNKEIYKILSENISNIYD